MKGKLAAANITQIINELKKINILTPIKIKTHGEKIIEVINE